MASCGKVVSYDKFKSIIEKGFGFCDVVFGWDAADLAYDNAKLTGWHTGYPDAQAVVDINSFRQVPWENCLAPQPILAMRKEWACPPVPGAY